MALNVQERLGGNELTCLGDQARDYAPSVLGRQHPARLPLRLG